MTPTSSSTLSAAHAAADVAPATPAMDAAFVTSETVASEPSAPTGAKPPLSWRSGALIAWDSFRRTPIFWIGIAILAIPTLIELATRGWGTDQAAHAPIAFATAIWIFIRSAPGAVAAMAPPRGWTAALLLAPCLLLYAAARITGLMEIRGLAAYLTIVAILYSVGGTRMLKMLWFPLLYSLFLIPIPDTFVDMATQPIKLEISKTVVAILAALDYPVATSGVSIYIGQFELLIAAACAGLNSLISLTAIGSFYVYLRHNASWRYTLVLVMAIFPIAVFANFVRVMALVLLTYYGGEAVAQGFLHEFAGLFLFVVAVLMIFLIDNILSAFLRRFRRKTV